MMDIRCLTANMNGPLPLSGTERRRFQLPFQGRNDNRRSHYFQFVDFLMDDQNVLSGANSVLPEIHWKRGGRNLPQPLFKKRGAARATQRHWN